MPQQNKPRYRLIAQYRDDKVMIEMIAEASLLIKSAHEILADLKMLRGFLPEDAAMIGVIAGMTAAEKNAKP